VFAHNAVRLGVQAFEILEQRMSLDLSRARSLEPSLTGLNLPFARGDVAPRVLRGAQSVCRDFARWSRTATTFMGNNYRLEDVGNSELLTSLSELVQESNVLTGRLLAHRAKGCAICSPVIASPRALSGA